MPLGKANCGFKKADESLGLKSVAIDGAAAESLGYQLSLVEEIKNDLFVISQAAGTAQRLSDGRFELGLGP